MSFAIHRVALASMLVSIASVAMAQTAGMTTDRDGNTGYATPEACDAAIQGGTAKFYKPQTKQKPKLRAGEASVSPMLLKDLSPTYAKGACDKGVATARGRGGVSKALQGKWIPFSPTMEVNAYKDASGKIVRVTMRQCDNHFSDLLPRPTPVAAAPAPVPAAAPTPAPVAAAPAPAPVAPAPVPKAAEVVAFPYVFGTLGAQRDLIGNGPIDGIAQHNDHDTKPALQLGAGYQFNKLWGAEAFAQFGSSHNFENGLESKVSALGLRGTVGTDLGEATRLFGKAGVARVKHTDAVEGTQTRPTLGLGLTHAFTKNLSLRSDFDVFLKKSSDEARSWKELMYLGVGVQYNFK
ncbi:porin family protein [Hydrogenophaga sp. NH-16]|uniref:outer membrane protein n=1 Tax=Hydrogenophaga sp. NH-16 TaxID=2184519 RepID=UPI000FDA522E|nr:porin family protein [Hydrogenophaga sp. NH-16]